MSDRHEREGPTPARNLGGRPRVPDPRLHRIRVGCNAEELLKFRLLASLNHDLEIGPMIRDIVLDELNLMLSEFPRHELIATLQAQGLDAPAIDALLKSL